MTKKIVIIGGSIAGISSAIALCENGVRAEDILIIEREEELGGLLKYILDGKYGLFSFNRYITSYEFLEFLIAQLNTLKIEVYLQSIVKSIEKKRIQVISKNKGNIDIEFESIIIATGSRQVINLDSYIYGNYILEGLTSCVNFHKNIAINGILLSEDVLIMGSGSRELYLAKRIILEGGNVKGIIEKGDKVVCRDLNLINFINLNNVEIYLNSSIHKIRLNEGLFKFMDVTINVQHKTYKTIGCRKIISPAKYKGNNDFLKDYIKLGKYSEIIIDDRFMTSREGVFSIGNSVNLHGNVDGIFVNSFYLAKNVVEYLKFEKSNCNELEVVYDVDKIEFITPQKIKNLNNEIYLFVSCSHKNTYELVEIFINGKKYDKIRFIRFERYFEVIVDLSLYKNNIKTFEVNIL